MHIKLLMLPLYTKIVETPCFSFGLTGFLNISKCVMRHDTESATPLSEAYRCLPFHGFHSRLGQRVSTIPKYLFPAPNPDSKIGFVSANLNDVISFRHHIYEKERRTEYV